MTIQPSDSHVLVPADRHRAVLDQLDAARFENDGLHAQVAALKLQLVAARSELAVLRKERRERKP